MNEYEIKTTVRCKCGELMTMETLDRPDGSKWVCACGETITYSSYSQLNRKLEEARLARDAARAEVERERKHARQVVNEAIETCHDALVLEEAARAEVEAWRRRTERIGSLLPYTILIEDTPWPDIKKALVSGDVDALDKLIGVKP